MNSPEDFKNHMKGGFTLVEILVVFGVSMILVGLTTPIGFRYYQTQLVDESSLLVYDTLQRAERSALYQKDDSNHGVSFDGRTFVLFEGDSFALRDKTRDETFVLSDNTEVDSPSEIVFSKKTGVPNEAGTVDISTGSIHRYVDVSQIGVIERR